MLIFILCSMCVWEKKNWTKISLPFFNRDVVRICMCKWNLFLQMFYTWINCYLMRLYYFILFYSEFCITSTFPFNHRYFRAAIRWKQNRIRFDIFSHSYHCRCAVCLHVLIIVMIFPCIFLYFWSQCQSLFLAHNISINEKRVIKTAASVLNFSIITCD